MHLKALAKIMEPRTYRLDEVIYTEKSKATEMVILDVGECRVEVEVDAERTRTGTLSDGSAAIRPLTASESKATAACLGKQKVQLGRIGPASVLASYMLLGETAFDDINHEETVIASSMSRGYVVWKNDFLFHMPDHIRICIRNLVKKFSRKLIPKLWDQEPLQVGEDEWKQGKAWDFFRNDLISKKNSANIISSLK